MWKNARVYYQEYRNTCATVQKFMCNSAGVHVQRCWGKCAEILKYSFRSAGGQKGFRSKYSGLPENKCRNQKYCTRETLNLLTQVQSSNNPYLKIYIYIYIYICSIISAGLRGDNTQTDRQTDGYRGYQTKSAQGLCLPKEDPKGALTLPRSTVSALKALS